MNRAEFESYMTLFEREVVADGVTLRVLGRPELVPVRNGRLSRTMFGRVLGARVRSDEQFALDYYGLLKKSTGLIQQVETVTGMQIKMIETTVVHFASIRIEAVASLAPNLVKEFPIFKGLVLQWRRFPKNGRVKRNHS